jgi:branched-chain amino acid transport system substrate-binding protein
MSTSLWFIPLLRITTVLVGVLFTTALHAQNKNTDFARKKCVAFGFKENTVPHDNCTKQYLESSAASKQTAKPISTTTAAQLEEKFWDGATAAGNKAAFDAYLESYPKGRYAGLARANVERLKGALMSQQQALDAAAQKLAAERAIFEAEQKATNERMAAEAAKKLADERTANMAKQKPSVLRSIEDVRLDESVVTIAHVGPLSGGIAHLGKDNENGSILAVEELNALGVYIAGKKVRIKLLLEDDRGDPNHAVTVAQKLVNASVSGVIGHLNSGTSIPASKLYSDAGIPQISPSSTNPKFTRQGFKTAFRIIADDASMGQFLGRYAVQTLRGTQVAIVDDRTAYGQGLADVFGQAVEAAGGKVVAREFTTAKATDFYSILSSIKGRGVDLIFFGGMDTVAAPMLIQMNSLGIRAKFLGGDGICGSFLTRSVGSSVIDDQVFCAEAGGFEGRLTSGMQEFQKKYKARFGGDVQIYAPYTYDATKILIGAMVKAGSSNPDKYLSFLASTSQYQGVTGPISFDTKGDVLNGAFTIKVIRGGKFQMIGVARMQAVQ